MNRREIVDRLGARPGTSKLVGTEAVVGLLKRATEALRNEGEVNILALATVGVRKRPAHSGRNPRTGERVSIALSILQIFKAGKTLKDAVSRGGLS